MKDSKNPPPYRFSFIDLFAGIGGFSLGMQALGGECLYANEWDKFAAQTYAAWHGSHKLDVRDLRSIDFHNDIPDHDLLLAGFPCQPFSIAGVSKKNSLGREHGFNDLKQGNLFFSIAAIAEAKRPPILLLENVKNLKSHDQGRTWRIIHESLAALGYQVFSKILDASHWVPQHRERVFLVCFDTTKFLPSELEAFRFPDPPNLGPRLSSILEPAPDQKYMLSDRLWDYLQRYALKHKLKGNGFGYQVVGPDDVTRTMSARYYKDGSEILVSQPGWKNPRKLTPLEAAKLMGFNGEYARLCGLGDVFPQVVSDVQAYKQFGNSVSPAVVTALGRQVLEVLELRRLRLSKTQSL